MPPSNPTPQNYLPPQTPQQPVVPQEQSSVPGQLPEQQPPAGPPTSESFKKSKGLNKKSLLAFIGIFGLVGGIGLYLAFASHTGSIRYYWATYRLEETFWDGQVHTKKDECLKNMFVCHDNGKLIITGANTRSWESDQSKNNPKKLKSAAWYGPFLYASTYHNWYGFGTTGNSNACFNVKDVSQGKNRAELVLLVQNEADGKYPTQTVKSLSGTLDNKYKKDFRSICMSYYNNHDALYQQYMIYVRSGKIQVDYVDVQHQYYYYDYNPYPYSYSFSVTSPTTGAKQQQSPALCSETLKKSNNSCLNKKDLEAAKAEKNLSNLQTNPVLEFE